MEEAEAPNKETLDRERHEVLSQIEDWLELPMLALGVAWLVLTVVDFMSGLNPLLDATSTVIWVIFILDFALRFTLAPKKLQYLKGNWLAVISLLVPALRVFRLARFVRVLNAARATRGLRLFKVVSSLNRGMRTLGKVMGRRGFGYVVALTLMVTLIGAAGMYAFESEASTGIASGLNNYGSALWWTAMLMTTMGSEYWPVTTEGRVLAFLLSIYAFAVFGYVTATLATFFIGRDAENKEAELAGSSDIEALHREITALRAEVRTLVAQGSKKQED